MDRKAKTTRKGAALRAAAAWLLSLLILLSAAALLSSRLLLNDEQLTWISVGILFLSSAAAGLVFLIAGKDKASPATLLLLCLSAPVILLILGLCIDGQSMSLASSGRVLLGGLLSFMLCLLIRQGMKHGKGKKRFLRASS